MFFYNSSTLAPSIDILSEAVNEHITKLDHFRLG